jgi:hypothetical protein
MNVDEMIRFLKGCTSVGQYPPSQIEAALRAAEKMYKGYVILERQARQCGFLDSQDHERLLRAWDAAVKEEV